MFFFTMSFNLVLPEMNAVITNLDGAELKGWIIGLFTISAGISRPFSGKLADFIGRKKVLLVGVFFSLLICLLYPFAFSVWFLLTESYLSFKAGGLTSEELSRIISVVVTNFAAVNLDESARKRILGLMHNDKKNSGNRILGVLLQGLGSAVWDQEYQEMDVMEALMFLEDCYQAK
jgi:MFS family permease